MENKEKRRKNIHVIKKNLLMISIFFIAFALLLISFFAPKLLLSTGRAGSSVNAAVTFSIDFAPILNITSPKNITYNFSIGQNYTLDLNVSANTAIASWSYSLYDLRHNVWAYQNVAFLPNTTFDAVRWGNRLDVNATATSGQSLSGKVTFFVSVPNSAPIIYNMTSPIYVCEGSTLNYNYYAVDLDEDALDTLISNGGGYFFVFPNGVNLYGNTSYFILASGTLIKAAAGGANSGSQVYNSFISVVERSTPDLYSDTFPSNITVIEINNPPFVEELGATTLIWNQGDNSTLNKSFIVNDIEFSNWGYGNLSLRTTIRNSSGNLFNYFNATFNGTHGVINFTANSSTQIGNYIVDICATDTGLSNPHSQINSVCGQNGSSRTTCDSFQLTITNQNRAPTIVSHYPDKSLQYNFSGVTPIYFNITKHDPDGTIPDAYWFVDGILKEFDEGNATDEFIYSFECGISGNHKVKVEISDGLLNDSIEWNMTVFPVDCPNPSSGGGGGGGGGAICTPKWGCSAWDVCQNAQISLEEGILSGVNYRVVSDSCTAQQLTDERCGVQTRICSDLNNCNLNSQRPKEFQSCLFIENPSCEDGIRNCHDGECEVLVDCGGTCGQCASCSDKIKNQGEEDVDCGGPCPFICEEPIPLIRKNYTIYIFLVLLLLVIIFVIYKLTKVLKYKKELKGSKNI